MTAEGQAAAEPAGPALCLWENEGGAAARDAMAIIPADVTVVVETHYRVGPYRYTNLADALAQYHRQPMGAAGPE